MIEFTTVTMPPLLAAAVAQRQADEAGGNYSTLNTTPEKGLYMAIVL